jgi:transcriptional regulator with XRE-family HTH domain
LQREHTLMAASLSIEPPCHNADPGNAHQPASTERKYGRRDSTDDAVRDAINAHIGRKISAIRRSRGMTQAALGEVLGLSNQQIQKYEKGKNGLSLERVWRIACYFGIELADLLEGIEEEALGTAAPRPRQKCPRLRLAVAQAVRRAKSTHLLRGVLQLLRASEAEPPPGEDVGDAAR